MELVVIALFMAEVTMALLKLEMPQIKAIVKRQDPGTMVKEWGWAFAYYYNVVVEKSQMPALLEWAKSHPCKLERDMKKHSDGKPYYGYDSEEINLGCLLPTEIFKWTAKVFFTDDENEGPLEFKGIAEGSAEWDRHHENYKIEEKISDQLNLLFPSAANIEFEVDN